MSITHWAAGHRRSILFMVGILALAGVAVGIRLPVALFPHIDFPRIVVMLDSGDRSADQMVIEATRKVEQAVRSVPGVVSIRSTTSRGSAELSINFGWGDDMISAMLQVESVVNQSLSDLPPGTKFTVRRMDPTVFPIAAYSLTSESESQIKLRDLAKYSLVPLLSSVPGVAKVSVMGGDTAEYRVEVDPQKLAAYGLSFADVAKAVSANNVLQAVGRLEDHYKLYLLLSDIRIQSLKTIEDTVLRSGNSGLVKLEDIARVYATSAPKWQRVTADGRDAVLVQVYQQPGGNTVQIVKNVNQRLSKYRDRIPKDVKVANWYDQSDLVTASAKSVRDAIVIGVILAALVLFVFLRSMKIALVGVLIVPSVLASTVLLLYLFNMSFNIMTLGGMAAAVGLIIDDAIVMVEHILRRLRERNSELQRSVRQAAIEFTSPLAGSSAATIIVFAPLAFLSGVTGAFFKALSLTMASSLIISFLLAWLAIPLLAEHLLSRKDAEVEDSQPLFERILRFYRFAMARLMRTPVLILIGVLPLMLLGYFGYRQVGTGFIPKMDEGGFVLDYRTPAGTSLAETDRLLQQVEKILTENKSVETYSRRTGAQLGGGLSEANEGDFFVRLKPFPRPPIGQVMDQIRSRIEQQVPGIELEMALLMEDLIGDLTAVPQPIEIKLYGEDFDQLMKTAPKVAAAIEKVPGIVDVQDGVVLAGDAVNIVVDRDKAALAGIEPGEVTQQLDAWFHGTVTTNVQGKIKQTQVRVWVPQGVRDRVSAIKNVQLRAQDGHLVPLRRIAKIDIETGQPQITRDNLQRMVAVTGRISGRDLGSTMRDVQHLLKKRGFLPKSIYFELGGLYKQQQIAFKGLLFTFTAAIALIYLLLLFLYEDFAASTAIVITSLLGMAAVFSGLWITGTELNITAIMGMTMIVGMFTEVAIFYFSEYRSLRKNKMEFSQALVKAGENRLRPISMTTITAIFALLPLALTLGEGAAMQHPLAVAIISGLLVQVPMVVIVMPLIYRVLVSVSLRPFWRRAKA
ncbi:efflux RND transporter permease subunit [Microbulbifer sp. SAOS-129_SWC]|uniref:efflux RND transporter permease subunit n=1 Tax=Microbulbifer sp. SAOS-129_SWC TaxID=3145235 RepID=UPI003217FC99